MLINTAEFYQTKNWDKFSTALIDS